MESPHSPGSSREPHWGSDDGLDASELSQAAAAYAATPQLWPTRAAPSPSSSSISTVQQEQQQHQQQPPTAASGDAEPGFMPLDQLPTFGMPSEAWEQQHSREAAGGAAAAATMSFLQQAGEDAGSHMQLDAGIELSTAHAQAATVGAGAGALHTVSVSGHIQQITYASCPWASRDICSDSNECH